MTSTFYELAIGGVFFAPFVTYAGLSLIIILFVRPILHFVGFAKMFSHVSVAELGLYVTILGILVVLF
jgi:hypothetical protein